MSDENSDLPLDASSNEVSDTMRRCEFLIRKYAPALMRQGGFLRDGIKKGAKLSEELRLRVIELVLSGKTHAQVTKITGVSGNKIISIMRQYRDPTWVPAKPQVAEPETPIDSYESCPNCKGSWIGKPIPEYQLHLHPRGRTHFSLLIARGHDGADAWECPHCKAQWDAFTNQRLPL